MAKKRKRSKAPSLETGGKRLRTGPSRSTPRMTASNHTKGKSSTNATASPSGRLSTVQSEAPSSKKSDPQSAVATDEIDTPDPLRFHLSRLISSRQYPKTICPSEACRALSKDELRRIGVESWRELMPACRDIAWKLRDQGDVELLQKGQVLANDIGVDEVRGPVRIRKKLLSLDEV